MISCMPHPLKIQENVYIFADVSHFLLLFLDVWQGINDPGQTQQKDGHRGLSFCHPNLLCRLDQMLTVMELSQHLVSSLKTVKPIIPRGTRCMGHLKIMCSTVCLPAPTRISLKGRDTICAWTNRNAQGQYTDD